jgi:hypothetical protein
VLFTSHGYLLEIWQGGTLVYPESQLQAVKAALVKFQQQNDTKASPALAVTYSGGNVCPVRHRR